jgi:hypothetical protein
MRVESGHARASASRLAHLGWVLSRRYRQSLLVLQTKSAMPDVLSNPAGGLVSCFEGDERKVVQTFFLTNARRRYRKRWWRSLPSDDEMLAEEYPDIRLDGLDEVAVTTPMLTQPP